MAYNNANMLRIAQIGAMTRPQFRNMPTLDLGGAVDNFTKARDKSLEAARRQAYVDELTAQHPEAAAQIAANPDAYAKMINDNAAAERDQQFKMDMLDKQFNNSIALQDRQHANAVGLAKLRMDLENQAGERAKAQRMAQLDEALKSGTISQEQYNMAKQRELLGDIVKGDSNMFGTTPIGNALTITSNPENFTEEQVKWANNYLKNGDYDYIYNKSYNQAAGKGAADLEFSPQIKFAQETAKNNATQQEKANTFEANMPSLKEMTDKLIDLSEKATYTQAGILRDDLLRQLDLPMSEGGIAREEYKQTVSNELLPKLRETYGGQLSDSEREALLSTLGDVNLSPAEKRAAVKSFMESKQRQMEAYQRRNQQNNSTQNQDIIDASEYFK